MGKWTRLSISLLVVFFITLLLTPIVSAAGENSKQKALDPAGIQRLKNDSKGKIKISISDSTGGVSFVGFSVGARPKGLEKAASAQDKSSAFFREYGSVFGLKNSLSELELIEDKNDRQGGKHLTYGQKYFGVPVFAGVMKTHFDVAGNLRSANGAVIPEITVNPRPTLQSEKAAATALTKVSKEHGFDKSISVRSTQLYVYRTGLFQGVAGENHLVWQVEVGNGSSVREFVFIDAHTGKFVDQITGIFDDLFRRAYDGANLPNVPPSYPDEPFWVEGDDFPTGSCGSRQYDYRFQGNVRFLFQLFRARFL